MSSNQIYDGISKEAFTKEKEANEGQDDETEINKEMIEIKEIMTREEISTSEEITTDDENMTDEEIMTDEELEQFRRETFYNLRATAIEVVQLETRYAEGGEFVAEINNAADIFNDSFDMLEKTGRANIEKFRRDIAQLMMETKYFSLSCEIVMYSCKKRWHIEVGKENKEKLLANCMETLLNFSDSSDEFAIALAKESGFVETVKQILEDFLPKYFAEGKGSELEVNGFQYS